LTTPSSSNAATPLNPDPRDTPLPNSTGEESDHVPAQGLMDGEPAPASASPAQARAIKPWMFVPVLYFMQFLPNGLVTSMFSATYKSLGVDNLKIATWTGLAALPWSFKMFWGPLVDVNFTKRRWTTAMQVLLFATLLLTAGAMASTNYFVFTVACLFLMATLSATHDIACDGLYLMSLDRKRQAAFSGVMAAFSRLGRLFVDSGLVVIAGRLIKKGWDEKTSWLIAIGIAALFYGVGMIWNWFHLPRPAADKPAADVAPGERTKNIWRTLTIIAAGVVAYYLINGTLQLLAHAIFHSVRAGAVPANWNLTGQEFINQWIKIAVAVVLLPVLWFLIRAQVRGTPMADAFVTYVKQPGFGAILSFIVFYRFGEAMIFAMAALFILDKRALGGMEVSVEQLGVIKGIAQSFGLIFGGLLGGWWIARVGLRRAFWPLVVCMHVPNVLYVWAAYTQPAPSMLYPVVFFEAFGYGVGFAGYFVYLMHVAQRGNFVTSHYAIGTGLGALFITFATILAGIVQSVFGYKGVFIAACLFTIPGTLTLLLIPMDDEETKKVKAVGGH
jgi:PAT family beta-lactamase induction signal transducer AmpG